MFRAAMSGWVGEVFAASSSFPFKAATKLKVKRCSAREDEMKGRYIRLDEKSNPYFGISELVLRVRHQSHCQRPQIGPAAQRS